MGWRLLRWLWGAGVEPEFVAAGRGRVVVTALPLRTIRVPVEEDSLIRTFSPKPPAEVDHINFDYSARLAAGGDTIDSIESVDVVEGADEALEVSGFAHANGVVSAQWTGGTLDVEYTLECIVSTVGGRTWPIRATVYIAH
jgi:hypothetical protein